MLRFPPFIPFSLFFADHGKVLKTINAASADDSSKVSSVVIEELDVLAKPEPIRNLKITRSIQYGEFDVSLFQLGEKIAFYPRQDFTPRDVSTPSSDRPTRKIILSLFASNVVK